MFCRASSFWSNMSQTLLRRCPTILKTNGSRSLSSVPSERKADFVPRVINTESFPPIEVKKLRRGPGGRSSYSGLTVTIFGATGFLARSLVNALAKTGSQVIIPYRSDPYKLRELKLAGDLGQVLFLPFYLRDTDSIYRAMKYSNVVINLIGKDNETNNFDFDSVHVEGARAIARIARESGIKRLLHVSALNSSPNPEAHYVKGGSKFLKSKYYGELAVREEFPEATIFRPADIYGIMDRYLVYYCCYYRRRYRRLALPYGGYGITKTPVCVSDVAEGIANAVSDEDSIGQTYDCVGPRRYELRELMEYLQQVIEKNPDEGFRITNFRWDLIMKARYQFYSTFKGVYKYPWIHWEKLERECISDEKSKNPTLLDLGVRLTFVEDRWPFDLVPWRYNFAYDGDLGEKKLYQNPKFIVE